MKTSFRNVVIGCLLSAGSVQAAVISEPDQIRRYLTRFPVITNAISASLLTKEFATVTTLSVRGREFAKSVGDVGLRYECEVEFVATLSNKEFISASERFDGRCTGIPR